MDFVLVSIAGLSLFLAIAMGAILFTVLREDRRRSDARVAALNVAAAALDLPLAAEDHDTFAAEAPTVLRSGDLFAVAAEPSPWVRRIGVAAALASVIALAGYLLLPATAAQAPVGAAQGGPQHPLELVTLTHTQQPSGLTISGTVYNPREGTAVSQVFAAVVLFGPEGNFLTSARAPLDFATLTPGQESPFVISVPVSATVARYRVGFRTADGSVIAHVDRRADATAAQNSAAGSTPWVPTTR
jgi:hypothetical protein